MFALVDCNSFYASCEQIFRPELRGKPVVVLSNNDGCIVARSAEAKALAIPDLTPYFKMRPFLQANRVHVFSSNYELYGDISRRIMDTLADYGELEIYSIDEGFLQLDGFSPIQLKQLGEEIRQRIWREVRIPVSIGVAPTKTLAKLANHAAKKSQRLNGNCLLHSDGVIQQALRRAHVGDIWGIGSRTARSLQMLDIETAQALCRSDPKLIRRHFSVNLERTIRELNGTSCLQLDELSEKKQIYCSRMFGEKTGELQDLLQAASQYSHRACIKLRRQHSLTRSVYVQLMTSRFAERPYRNSAVGVLPCATDETRDISRLAKELLKQIYRPGYAYSKVAVGLTELYPKHMYQLGLFERQRQSDRLMNIMDSCNHQQHGSLFLASEGIDRRWQMQRRMKSPGYTTRWDDIPEIQND